MRCVKPEFWTSEQVMDLSLDTRLLFIGMWNFCDDAGIHPASEKRLKAEVFPGDDMSSPDVRRMVDELIRAQLIEEYEVGGARFWIVTGWHHQKIDQPTFKHPTPDGVIPAGAPKRRQTGVPAKTSPSNQPEDGECSPNTPRSLDGCSPPEGKGEEGKGLKPLSGEPDDTDIQDREDEAEVPGSDSVQEILGHLNARTGSNFRKVDSNVQLVAARLREGATVKQCKAVIDAKVSEWGKDKKFSLYLRPKTLFNATNFEQYLAQIGPTASGGEWWVPAGFTKEWQATNAGCTQTNAYQWRNGERIEEPA
jgi:uncharacterized phage protein (TIGR02220 family)